MIATTVTLAAVALSPAYAFYTCSGGTSLTAIFSSPPPGNVVLVIAGTDARITLPQVKSADGGRYANDEMEFWIRGKEATLTRAGRKETCQAK